MTTLLSVLVIISAVVAVIRSIDVRFVLLIAALLLGIIAGDVAQIFREFLTTFSNEKFVVPICSAMGFAYVLRYTECDQHLVRLLVSPVRKVRWMILPGVVLVGFIVNIPIISQTSTAVCIGPVVIPLLRTLGYKAVTIGACLMLGASIGGELINPGAPELLTVAARTKQDPREIVQTTLPYLLIYFSTATICFWFLALRYERKNQNHIDQFPDPLIAETNLQPINYLKAFVPVIPLLFLFVSGPPFHLFHIPQRLMIPYPAIEESQAMAGGVAAFAAEQRLDVRSGSRLIGLAMLLGVACACFSAPRKMTLCMKEFFNGAGYGFTNIISLIVVANAFGKGIEMTGLAGKLGDIIRQNQSLLTPLAAFCPWLFAMICGSGMATTQSLYSFFHGPAIEAGANATKIGSIVSIASAAGRTMSPVAAVVLMASTMTGTKPWELIRLVSLPLIAGVVVVVVARMLGL